MSRLSNNIKGRLHKYFQIKLGLSTRKRRNNGTDDK